MLQKWWILKKCSFWVVAVKIVFSWVFLFWKTQILSFLMIYCMFVAFTAISGHWCINGIFLLLKSTLLSKSALKSLDLSLIRWCAQKVTSTLRQIVTECSNVKKQAFFRVKALVYCCKTGVNSTRIDNKFDAFLKKC